MFCFSAPFVDGLINASKASNIVAGTLDVEIGRQIYVKCYIQRFCLRQSLHLSNSKVARTRTKKMKFVLMRLLRENKPPTLKIAASSVLEPTENTDTCEDFDNNNWHFGEKTVAVTNSGKRVDVQPLGFSGNV